MFGCFSLAVVFSCQDAVAEEVRVGTSELIQATRTGKRDRDSIGTSRVHEMVRWVGLSKPQTKKQGVKA